jgi:hypothetical protein
MDRNTIEQVQERSTKPTKPGGVSFLLGSLPLFFFFFSPTLDPEDELES